MTQSNNGKKIIENIPKELILTETDFPFVENSNIEKVHSYLSILWNLSVDEVEQVVSNNFFGLIRKMQ